MSDRPTSGDDPIAEVNAVRRQRGVWYLATAAVLAALTLGVGVAVNEAQDAQDDVTATNEAAVTRDVRIENLETALDAQREQFEACRTKKANAPGCTSPVAPEPADVGPTGETGLRGRVGVRGGQGPQGVPGEDGNNGTPGRNGSNGQDGDDGAPGSTGDTGADGSEGDPGAAGPQGPAGPAGPAGRNGSDGATGPAGPPGPTGPAGYPESFTYTDALGVEHTCTDPDGDRQYTCT